MNNVENPFAPDSYCHGCDTEVITILDEETQEIKCNRCGCNFVEHLGQGVEGFIQPQSMEAPAHSPTGTTSNLPATAVPTPHYSSNDNGTTSHGPDGNELLQRILSRVLSMQVQMGSSNNGPLLNVLQNAASENNDRPVGIVVRQSISADDFALLSSAIGARTAENTGTSRLSSILGGLGPTATGGVAGPRSVGGLRPSGRGTSGLSSLLNALLGGSNSNDAYIPGVGNRSFEELLNHILMHEQSHAGAPPATETIIESLKRQVVVADMDLAHLGDSCSITHEAFEVGDVAVSLPCGHSYKEDSIVQWLQMHNTCPVCRIRVSTAEEEAASNETDVGALV